MTIVRLIFKQKMVLNIPISRMQGKMHFFRTTVSIVYILGSKKKKKKCALFHVEYFEN